MQEAGNIQPNFRHADVVLLSTGFRRSGITEQQSPGPLIGLRERLSQLPGVTAVAHSTMVPLGHVSARFFELLGVPVLQGRTFSLEDEGRKDIVIVSQSLANELWPSELALGRNVSFGPGLEA